MCIRDRLQSVPEGQKSAFLVKAILDSARQDALESTLRLSLIHISEIERRGTRI